MNRLLFVKEILEIIQSVLLEYRQEKQINLKLYQKNYSLNHE